MRKYACRDSRGKFLINVFRPSETELVVIESKDDSSSKTGQEATLITLQDDNEAMER